MHLSQLGAVWDLLGLGLVRWRPGCPDFALLVGERARASKKRDAEPEAEPEAQGQGQVVVVVVARARFAHRWGRHRLHTGTGLDTHMAGRAYRGRLR